VRIPSPEPPKTLGLKVFAPHSQGLEVVGARLRNHLLHEVERRGLIPIGDVQLGHHMISEEELIRSMPEYVVRGKLHVECPFKPGDWAVTGSVRAIKPPDLSEIFKEEL
jgi:hypothetical protein